jgi:hypothetical protein
MEVSTKKLQKIGQKEKKERTKSKYFLLENINRHRELTRSKLSSRNQDRKNMQSKNEIIVLPRVDERRSQIDSLSFPSFCPLSILLSLFCRVERSGRERCFDFRAKENKRQGKGVRKRERDCWKTRYRGIIRPAPDGKFCCFIYYNDGINVAS